jgi:uncharacterized membrane protein YfcA
MDGTTLAVLLLSLFAGAFVSGLAGFAMGIIVLGVWLHFLPPVLCALLVPAFGLVTQGYGVWKLRHAFSWRRMAPFAAGSLVGVPLGTALLTRSDPDQLRLGIGLFVILYSAYGLARPALRVPRSNPPADVGVGLANGVLAGLTGLVGIVIAIWCQLRGWSKDVQRTVFQPVMVMTSLASVASLGAAGQASIEALWLFLLGVPFTFAGTWLGLRLYGRVSESGFRLVVLALLLLSGLSLVVSRLGA